MGCTVKEQNKAKSRVGGVTSKAAQERQAPRRTLKDEGAVVGAAGAQPSPGSEWCRAQRSPPWGFRFVMSSHEQRPTGGKGWFYDLI